MVSGCGCSKALRAPSATPTSIARAQGGGFIPDDLPESTTRPLSSAARSGHAPSLDRPPGLHMPPSLQGPSAAPVAQEEDNFDYEAEAAMDELESRGAAPPPRACPAPAKPARSASSCEDCDSAEGHPRFREMFGISVCYDCQRAASAPGGKYQLVTKTRAKEDYLLTDRQ